MELGISTDPRPECYLIAVEGEVDISNADALRQAVDLALEQPVEQVKLDFGGVSYIDSTGIGVLVGAARRAGERGKGFSVANVGASVMRIVQLLGVDREMDISAA